MIHYIRNSSELRAVTSDCTIHFDPKILKSRDVFIGMTTVRDRIAAANRREATTRKEIRK